MVSKDAYPLLLDPLFFTSLYFIKCALSGSTKSPNPKVFREFNTSSPVSVFLFSIWPLSLALLVMKLMNSVAHSSTNSLASLVIFALRGRTFFMMRATFAIGRPLSSSLTSTSV
nr:uncharacterized protein A4U43_UnF9640 [Ipomoea batatas]GME12895.1 uncharacterized protein A4U43_UnF9640 [Ipomoea batatas]